MWQTVVENWNRLTKQQKFSVAVLSVCGIFAVGLSLYRVRAAVVEPFLVNTSELLKAKGVIGETPDQATAREKRTDTDGDGLSDWDETNVYRTNPNLKDTCGDGITDNVRVATGKNLNCDLPASTSGAPEPASQTPSPIPSNDSAGTSAKNPVTSGDASGVPPRDPAAIRALLNGKVDQAKLDALSDQDLLQLYDEAIAAQNQQAGVATPTN